MASSPLQHSLLQQIASSSNIPAPATFKLFPVPSRRPASKSLRLPARKPLSPKAPPPSPRNLSSTYIKNQNAEKLAEICREAPAHLARNLSISSEDSVPGLTDEHTESDLSTDEERYQATMSELWDSYHDFSSSTRPANQEYVRVQRKPVRKQVKPLDRTWATDLTASLDIPMPSPGTPEFALQVQYQQVELSHP